VKNSKFITTLSLDDDDNPNKNLMQDGTQESRHFQYRVSPAECGISHTLGAVTRLDGD
jgi:hypothetical protein